ncbi:hypothetical protein CMQ_1917 [Grosmannia clavigera kw1407]|uniref:MIP18 family-like domain-containing protein n=1 Tax=Grosmannia clavigera (strain kw1407 / UAMH 11150) TaxID=655863 RepID=F0XN14_GROCL|nr:uncharacterized protein CMQ_1917 [Grosmannia clavigera kw1407]EFX00836.1 hypothetical protein CMQ_1917 [Grosmannia clavigera kw1407]
MAELQNANPTILSAAELPSRRLRRETTSRHGEEFRFDSILAPKRPDSLFWGASHIAALASPPSPASSISSGGDVYDEGDDGDDGVYTEEPIDEQEIYEHPHTLGQLSVVNLPDIQISPSPLLAKSLDRDTLTRVVVYVTPTINHCSLVTVIGLAIRVRLEQTLPPNYRVDIEVKEGSHSQDDQVSKQLSDKERVAAALENDTLRGVLDKMLETCK